MARRCTTWEEGAGQSKGRNHAIILRICYVFFSTDLAHAGTREAAEWVQARILEHCAMVLAAYLSPYACGPVAVHHVCGTEARPPAQTAPCLGLMYGFCADQVGLPGEDVTKEVYAALASRQTSDEVQV